MTNSIFIFRRDFRFYDNIGLIECLKKSDKVIPIFIFTPEQIKKNVFKSDNAVQFMIESLLELKKELPSLSFFYGNYLDVLKEIVSNEKIESIYTNTDYTPYAIKRDSDIHKFCESKDIKFFSLHDLLIFEPGTVLNGENKYYQKFTPFYNLCLTKTVHKPRKINKELKNQMKKITNKYSVNNDDINKYYVHNDNLNVNGGRKNGLKILKSIKKHSDYNNTHNNLYIETTHLSAYIKFGCLSIREVFYKLVSVFNSKNPIVRQLIWREFYYHLGYGFTKRFGYSLKEHYDNIKWIKNKKHLELWKKGQTGFPIVDACMNQINTTGYMHNRGRLIVASFLIKNLGIDWREGEKYFAQSLVDYDVLVNNGNWQWVSGSGADSQQYIRVFNPSLQSEKYDSDCQYIKKWLPQLKDIPNRELHYWNQHYENYDLKEINYYKPIVDYKESKAKVMKIYKKGLH